MFIIPGPPPTNQLAERDTVVRPLSTTFISCGFVIGCDVIMSGGLIYFTRHDWLQVGETTTDGRQKWSTFQWFDAL